MDFKAIERLCMGCLGEMQDGDRFCAQCGFDNEQPKEPHYLPPRSILAGKYLVGRVLGEGGFGITYLGFDLNLNIKVAIKEYFPAGYVARAGSGATVTPFTGSSAEYYNNGIEKFLTEARSLARFHNLDGIVEVRDFFRENGTAYIVMEFVDGVNLREALERRGGRMPAAEVMALMQPLVASLVKVHQTGLVHRDISPDNIMLTPEGRLKLLDFGAARDVAGNKSVSVVLKPGYAPEEQYRTHGELGAWTDIYALCGTIYKLITGVTPPESVERLSNDTLRAPAQLGVSVAPAQEAALLRGLSVRKEGRFSYTNELYDALYGAASNPADAPRTAPVFAPSAAGFAPQAGVYAPQAAAYAPQAGAYAPQAAAPQRAESGFKKLWREKKGLLIAGFGGAGLIIALLVVLLVTKGGGKPPVSAPADSPAPVSTVGVMTPPTAAPQTPEPAAVAGTATFMDPGLFFEYTADESPDEGGTVYTYKGLDWYSILNYVMILDAQGCNVEVFDEGDVLFTVTEGDAVISFVTDADYDDILHMYCPSGVTLNLSAAPVTEHYLENNGLSGEAWAGLGMSDYYSYSSVNYMGNSNANNQITPEVAMQGNILYVADNNNSLGIFAIDYSTGEVIARLTDDDRHMYYLNVAENYLFYCAVESDGQDFVYTLCCVPTDGSSEPFELADDAHTIAVYGDYVYFLDSGDALKRLNLYTLDIETVLAEKSYFYNVSGDRIYCVDPGGAQGVYSFALDGTDQKLISNADCYSMTVCGGWIYYRTSENTGKTIRRVDIDGDGDELVLDVAVEHFYVGGGRIFYTVSGSNALKLYDLQGKSSYDLVDYGRFPSVFETATDILIFFSDENGDLCMYDSDTGTGTVVDMS
ncbi:MAG: DUF5050 domain-containing protein [Clostridiaceae bacterium]|nr:DUF5050 domain-containing protein [Eubacteriales bacterium]